jgi:hypothetical protein
MIGLRLERKHAAKEWALEQEYQQFLAEHGFRPKEK